LTLAVIAIAANAASVTPQFTPNCKDPQSNLEMRMCADQELKQADVELNEIYTRAIAAAREQTRAGREYGSPDLEALLREGERRWIAFREADCRYQYELYHGGTIAPLVELQCRLDLTKARAKELRVILDGDEEPVPPKP
jgi:uncharacterized protein YecT (DUF1311 family)